MPSKKNILLTGGAGFIGSHLADALIGDKRVGKVRVLDNLATGSIKNIQHLIAHPDFEFIQGDIRDIDVCKQATHGMDLVCHQAAMGSVARSIQDPLTTHGVNVTGTLNILFTAKESGIPRVVYAASSSTYGDHPGLPKQEDKIGNRYRPTQFLSALMNCMRGFFPVHMDWRRSDFVISMCSVLDKIPTDHTLP